MKNFNIGVFIGVFIIGFILIFYISGLIFGGDVDVEVGIILAILYLASINSGFLANRKEVEK